MNGITSKGDFIVNTNKETLIIENIDIGGDLIVSKECVGLKKLLLKGNIKIGGSLKCEIDECDLETRCRNYYVGGWTTGFEEIRKLYVEK